MWFHRLRLRVRLQGQTCKRTEPCWFWFRSRAPLTKSSSGVQPFPRGDHPHAGPPVEQPEGVERPEGAARRQDGRHRSGEEGQGGGGSECCGCPTR